MTLPPTGDIVIVVVGALVAGFVNGLSGTGYALASLGFWLHAMSPITAAPLTALCGVSGHLQSLPRIWSGVSWPRLWPYLTAGLIGVPIGTALLDRVQVQPLKLGVGLLLIVYVSWMAFMRHPPVIRGASISNGPPISRTTCRCWRLPWCHRPWRVSSTGPSSSGPRLPCPAP